jgi:hypothetical protein
MIQVPQFVFGRMLILSASFEEVSNPCRCCSPSTFLLAPRVPTEKLICPTQRIRALARSFFREEPFRTLSFVDCPFRNSSSVVTMASSLVALGARSQASTPSSPIYLKDNGTAQVSVTAKPVDDSLLLVSPYEDRPHLLDLNTLDTANQLLAKALVCMKNLREDYATAGYEQSFNWSEIIDSLRQLVAASNFEWTETAFYIVVFRSRIPPTTVYADLGVLDQAAHAEAMKSGGFLKSVILTTDAMFQANGELRYWFGTPDQSGRNLATCVW